MQFPLIPNLPPAGGGRPDVAPVQPTRPITAVEGGVVAGAERMSTAESPAQVGQEGPGRRQQPTRRSGEERRRRSEPVLLDTRSGRDRRVRRRRAEDPPPSGVDLSA